MLFLIREIVSDYQFHLGTEIPGLSEAEAEEEQGRADNSGRSRSNFNLRHNVKRKTDTDLLRVEENRQINGRVVRNPSIGYKIG
jgi:hypothetical protein